MSVIFNALQKSQRLLKERQSYSPRAVRRMLTETVLLLCLSVLWVLPPSLVSSRLMPSQPKTITAVKPMPPVQTENVVLNGIFFSGQVKVAMINNHLQGVGDRVGGMQVMRIGENEVELSDGTHKRILKSFM